MKTDFSDWKEFLLSLCTAFDEPTTERLKWAKWMRETGKAFLEGPPPYDIPVDNGTTPSCRPPDETNAHP